MARKNTISYPIKPQPPTTLDDNPFYGIQCDEYQKQFRDAIWNPDKLIVFCNAKAGTGKTTIATATANLLCEYGLYDGIIYIASPTQEQKQGYLAGSIEEKSEPYFEPFYEALQKMLAPGEIRHSGPGENRQFWPGENRQSLFTN